MGTTEKGWGADQIKIKLGICKAAFIIQDRPTWKRIAIVRKIIERETKRNYQLSELTAKI